MRRESGWENKKKGESGRYIIREEKNRLSKISLY